jgi:hypothetical protein
LTFKAGASGEREEGGALLVTASEEFREPGGETEGDPSVEEIVPWGSGLLVVYVPGFFLISREKGR